MRPLVSPISYLSDEVTAWRLELVAKHRLPVVEHDVDQRRGIGLQVLALILRHPVATHRGLLRHAVIDIRRERDPEKVHRLADSIAIAQRHAYSSLRSVFPGRSVRG